MSSIKLDRHDECKEILSRLIEVVRNCQSKYGGKKELASESDQIVLQLCEIWEEVVTFGLKTTNKSSVFNEFTDVFKVISSNNEFSFWDFCQTHLTHHDRERFLNLKHVWTNRGRTKAVLRNALNEHSLQRSLSMWLSDPVLQKIYEPWSLMIDTESTNLLPSIAGGLNSILFAITIDSPDVNAISKFGLIRKEPIILVPTPIGPSKKILPIERNIVTIDDDNDEVEDVVKLLDNQQNNVLGEQLSISPSSLSFNEKLLLDEKNQIPKNSNDIDDADVKQSTSTTISEIDMYLNNLNDKIVNNHSSKNNIEIEDIESESSSNLSKSTSSSFLNNSTNYLSVECCSHSSIKNLEEQLSIMTERCSFLEARIAELSLENRRLQRLGNFLNNDFGNYVITIPKSNLVTSKHSKYYEYEIHITSREQESWIISKRYSEFNKLHYEMLKKHNSLVKTIDFPPKKKLGNMNSSFVEERRLRLQIYLRHLVEVLPEILLCTSKEELQNAIPFFI